MATTNHAGGGGAAAASAAAAGPTTTTTTTRPGTASSSGGGNGGGVGSSALHTLMAGCEEHRREHEALAAQDGGSASQSEGFQANCIKVLQKLKGVLPKLLRAYYKCVEFCVARSNPLSSLALPLPDPHSHNPP